MRRLVTLLVLASVLMSSWAQVGGLFQASSISAATSFLETFNGAPGSPQTFTSPNWDIAVHGRDNRDLLRQFNNAEHGPDCGPAPATHATGGRFENTVFQCRDHVMTALHADGYGVTYLTPNHMVDFSQGEAVIRFDMSTARTSERDWVDVWITPYHDNLQLPLNPGFPDLQGPPRRAIQVLLTTESSFCPEVWRDGAAIEDSTAPYRCRLIGNYANIPGFPGVSATRRDTFEIRVSRTHLKVGMPAYNYWWYDHDLRQPLDWTQGVVQLGQHSYSPEKGTRYGNPTGPNTWHWDNVSISPSIPFTIMRADRRVADAAAPTLNFGAPAPANSHLRFSGWGSNVEFSTNGGANWQAAQKAVQGNDDSHIYNYWTPIAAGTQQVRFRSGTWWGGAWQVKDVAIWSSDILATPPPTPPAPVPTPTPTPPTSFVPVETWSFAEGYTAPGYDEFLTILNPGASAGSAIVKYYVEGESTPRQRSLSLPANSRTTVIVHADPSPSNPAGLGRLTVGHATRVETSVPVVVERPIYFQYNGTINGGHNVLGATSLATTWQFAEGYTAPGYDEFLTILNPGASAGTATINYYVEGESAPRQRSLSLPANSRVTVVVHGDPSPSNPGGLGRLGVGHATRVTTTVPVVVERPIYFQYNGTINGGHIVMGATAAATTWQFAEGYTAPGYDEFLTILNPSTSAGTATITYFVEGGGTVQRTVPLPATSRTTVAVHGDPSASNPGGLGRLSSGHATKVTSTVAVVVERPMYFQYSGAINGGHNVMGAAAAATTWQFAEGYTAPGYDEFLTILNPNASAGTATVTYYVEGGGTVVRPVTLPANSRVTVAVHGDPTPSNPAGLGRLAAGHATKITSTRSVIVERPMYFQYNGTINGGHNVMGRPS